MLNRRRLIFSSLLAIAMLSGFIPVSASAAPKPMSYRWNECTLWSGSFLAPTGTLEKSYLYRMRVFGSAITATCPVSLDGGSISSADVYVENSMLTGKISCCMSVLDEWGSTSVTSSCATATVGKNKLSLVVATPVTLPLGTAYIQCSLPSNNGDSTSGIIGYTVHRL